MIVDDDEPIRFLLRRIADRDDRCVLVAEVTDGASAASVAAEVRPDAIILDVHMPELDGIAAIPLIREAAPACRIVIFSSDPTRHDQALDAGADVWRSKTDGFSSVLDAALERPAPSSSRGVSR